MPTSTSTALGSSSGDANPAATVAPVDPFAIPEHLRDLQATELPEETRDVVLDQIASFRVTSVEREQAKKRQEEENERRRIEAMIYEQNANRTREQQATMRAKEVASEKEREKVRLGRGAAFGDGPQGWSKPVGFVAASGGSGGIERTDEEEEELRKERRRRDQADTLREVSTRFVIACGWECGADLSSCFGRGNDASSNENANDSSSSTEKSTPSANVRSRTPRSTTQ